MSSISWVAIVILGILHTGCKPDALSIEKNDERLVALMTDLYVADVAVNKSSPQIRDSLRKIYKNQINEIHGLPADAVDSVILKIQLDVERYKELNKKVLERLQETKDKYN